MLGREERTDLAEPDAHRTPESGVHLARASGSGPYARSRFEIWWRRRDDRQKIGVSRYLRLTNAVCGRIRERLSARDFEYGVEPLVRCWRLHRGMDILCALCSSLPFPF